MPPDPNPFAVLSLIVAPAILTNASSVLAMSTSNRLARAVDRAREISKQLQATNDLSSQEAERRLRELGAAVRPGRPTAAAKSSAPSSTAAPPAPMPSGGCD